MQEATRRNGPDKHVISTTRIYNHKYCHIYSVLTRRNRNVGTTLISNFSDTSSATSASTCTGEHNTEVHDSQLVSTQNREGCGGAVAGTANARGSPYKRPAPPFALHALYYNASHRLPFERVRWGSRRRGRGGAFPAVPQARWEDGSPPKRKEQ